MEKSCDLSVSPSPFVLDFGTWDFELWLFNFFEDYASKEKRSVDELRCHKGEEEKSFVLLHFILLHSSFFAFIL